MGIARTVTLANGKGGTGKTSVTANVAGLVAASGLRALAVDLDPQGNLRRDLGYTQDGGTDLLTSFVGGTPLPLLREVRPRLDVVPSGRAMYDLAALAYSRPARGGETLGATLARTLGAIAGDYDLVLIDTPPGEKHLVEAAFEAASTVIVATKTDDASLDGLQEVAERFTAARQTNPTLQLAGVVLFDLGSRSRRIERQTRETVEQMLGASAPIFATRVRHTESAALDARRAGLLVHELEAGAAGARTARLAALRTGAQVDETLTVSVDTAAGLADDYQNLTREILMRVAALEEVPA